MKTLAALLLLSFLTMPVFAGASEEDLTELKTLLLSLLDRVESLEAENRQLKTTAVTQPRPVESNRNWTDTMKIKGDFRYRYENIDAERSDTRERNRIRARVALTATPKDNLEIGIGMATGGENPVSTNQTLGAGGSTKDLRLDLAYFKWHAKPGLRVIGGKIKNVWHRAGGNGLVWDSDFRPEGLALTYHHDKLFVNTGFNFLESDSNASNSRISYGVQAGWDGRIGNNQLKVGISYFDIGVKGRKVFHGDDDEFFGNTFECSDPTNLATCVYDTDFEEVEFFAEVSTHIFETPVHLFANYVQNQDAGDLDTAWAAGFKFGKANRAKSWELAYIYQDLEANSVLALLTDSDFGGGGTDAKGHIIKGAYAFDKNWKVSITYFNNERNVDIGVAEDYDRLQLDTSFTF